MEGFLGLKVQYNYHIELREDRHYYSVPWQYKGKQVTVIYTDSVIEIYHKHIRIALHKRVHKRGYTTLMELINSTKVDLYGKRVVMVGHSDIVGKPISLLLLHKFATVSVCHIATGERGDLPQYVKNTEILIVAVGKANLIKGRWLKEGAIVIDVGINRVEGKIVGDVEFEVAKKKASYITPVPGGVGVR